MAERGAKLAPAPRSSAPVVKAAGYQSASVTLGASGFQERKEAWGHPALLPPFSSKQPGRADNGAVAPVPQEFGASGPTSYPKHEIRPRFLSHKSQTWCWGSSGWCRCHPAPVQDVEQHHTLARLQFHPSVSYWWELGVTGLYLLLCCAEGCRKVLGDCFTLGCPGARQVAPVQGQSRMWQGRGTMASCCSTTPGSPPTTTFWALRHTSRASDSPTKLAGSQSNARAGSVPLPPRQVAQEGAGTGAWSLLHPDTENN